MILQHHLLKALSFIVWFLHVERTQVLHLYRFLLNPPCCSRDPCLPCVAATLSLLRWLRSVTLNLNMVVSDQIALTSLGYFVLWCDFCMDFYFSIECCFSFGVNCLGFFSANNFEYGVIFTILILLVFKQGGKGVCLFIFWYLFQFLSSMFKYFHCAGCSFLWFSGLGLRLCIILRYIEWDCLFYFILTNILTETLSQSDSVKQTIKNNHSKYYGLLLNISC